MTGDSDVFHAVFLGAGPAGTGPLVNAAQRGLLPELLDAGIAVVDRQAEMGAGTIGQYRIDSDSAGGTFLECLAGQESGVFAPVFGTSAKRRLDEFRQAPPPLPLVGEFLGEIGRALRPCLDAHPVSCFHGHAEATEIRRTGDGLFTTTLTSRAVGTDVEIRSRYVISALGGRQDRDRARKAEIVPGLSLASGYADRTLCSGEVLSAGGAAAVRALLKRHASTRVVVVGGSHSAFSAAWLLLHRVGADFGLGDIVIMHRRTPRIFYPSVVAAHADGYTDFGASDLCPLTGRVYRLGGLRWHARDLLRQIWQLGEAPAERRVRLVALDESAVALLDDAAVIIPAFGYRPVTVPIRDANGRLIELLGSGPGPHPLVDDQCRVLSASGDPVPGLLGIGLASGFMPSGALGGEPSNTRQTNGLWLYQNGIGARILDQLLG
jgi:hypothetical protein